MRKAHLAILGRWRDSQQVGFWRCTKYRWHRSGILPEDEVTTELPRPDRGPSESTVEKKFLPDVLRAGLDGITLSRAESAKRYQCSIPTFDRARRRLRERGLIMFPNEPKGERGEYVPATYKAVQASLPAKNPAPIIRPIIGAPPLVVHEKTNAQALGGRPREWNTEKREMIHSAAKKYAGTEKGINRKFCEALDFGDVPLTSYWQTKGFISWL